MSRVTFLSQDDFNAKKKQAIDNEPINTQVRMSNIVIPEDAIKNEYIVIAGQEIPATASFFRELSYVLNVGKRLGNELTNTKKGGGAELLSSILNAIKSVKDLPKSKSDTVTLFASKESGALTGFAMGVPNRLANAALFKIVENEMNKYGILPSSVHIGPNGGVSIELLKEADLAFPKVGDNEVFYGGISFSNTNRTSRLDEFIMRLVCSNGMTHIDPVFGTPLTGLGPKELFDFTYNIAEFAHNKFLPQGFEDNLTRANNVRASLREVEEAYKIAKELMNTAEMAEDVRIQQEFALRDNYFPGLKTTYNRMKQAGFADRVLNQDEKKMVKTSMSVWDVINAMTFIASHNIGIPMAENKSRLTLSAGKMFVDSPDQVAVELLSI